MQQHLRSKILIFTDGEQSGGKRYSKEALADCLASLSDMAHTGVDTSLPQHDIPGKLQNKTYDFQEANNKREVFFIFHAFNYHIIMKVTFYDIHKHLSEDKKRKRIPEAILI